MILAHSPIRLICLTAATVFMTCFHVSAERAAAQTPAPASGPLSLASLYRDDFLIGVAIDFTENNPLAPEELAIIRTHFNSVTPENSMKPISVHPAEDRWTWGMADTLVDFCQASEIKVWGHTLVWHAQTGNWFFQGENDEPVTREKALERLKTHIHTQVTRYKGRVIGWDVVNEAIADSNNPSTENLRQSPWMRAIGPDYLTYAFRFAREADPDVQLYYNDYNIEKGAKHRSSLLLLKRLIEQGAPITGVGIQGHWSLTNLPYQQLDEAIANYKALGLRVAITELDITIRGQGGGQLGPATAPGDGPATRAAASGPAGRRGGARGGPIVPPTPDQLQAQAEAYAKFFKIFQKHSDVIDRVTFWGLNDARSWRRGQAPLLFDGQNKPKPAMDAIIAAKE
jgi:GH35 family endo-1,4-beta-xylanase